MKPSLTKEEWVAMFREIGLDEQQMKHWHRVFEQRHPEAHEAFLDHLGIPAAEIKEIRSL